MVLKRAKPTSPGRRGAVLSKTPDLWKGKPEKACLDINLNALVEIILGGLPSGTGVEVINKDIGLLILRGQWMVSRPWSLVLNMIPIGQLISHFWFTKTVLNHI